MGGVAENWVTQQEQTSILGSAIGATDRTSPLLEHSEINRTIATPKQAQLLVALRIYHRRCKWGFIYDLIQQVEKHQLTLDDHTRSQFVDVAKAIEAAEAKQKTIFEKIGGA